MPSQRIQRRIDTMLDEADEAFEGNNWVLVHELAQKVLMLDPKNSDAAIFLKAAESGLSGSHRAEGDLPARIQAETPGKSTPVETGPTSFGGGRYEVKRFPR